MPPTPTPTPTTITTTTTTTNGSTAARIAHIPVHPLTRCPTLLLTFHVSLTTPINSSSHPVKLWMTQEQTMPMQGSSQDPLARCWRAVQQLQWLSLQVSCWHLPVPPLLRHLMAAGSPGDPVPTRPSSCSHPRSCPLWHPRHPSSEPSWPHKLRRRHFQVWQVTIWEYQVFLNFYVIY